MRWGHWHVHPEQTDMTAATSFQRGIGPDGSDRISMVVPATNESTRTAIREIAGLIDAGRVVRDDIVQLEIALAEVFNNIVEHAYVGRNDGMMDILVEMRSPGMHFTIIDDGAAMPTGRLPGGETADPDRKAHEQPEGGYGLHLIRHIARKLRYERVEDSNKLSFRIALNSVDPSQV